MAAQTTWANLPAAFAGYAVGGLGRGVKNTLLRLPRGYRVNGYAPPASACGRTPGASSTDA
jgi:hypothetical protein